MDIKVILQSEPSPDQLDWLDFIAKVVDSLSWPLALVIVALLFRKRITALLDRIRKASYGDAAVEFDEQLESAEQKAAELPPPAEAPPHSEQDSKFERALELSPRLAVLDAWIEVEEAISELASRRGYTTPRSRSGTFAMRQLTREGAIDSRTSQLLDELRRLRNIAAHSSSETEITISDARRFKEISLIVASALSSKSQPDT